MDIGGLDVAVIVFWSIELLSWVDEGMDFCANSKGVEVVDVEDLELVEERSRVGSRWEVVDESDDFLLGSE